MGNKAKPRVLSLKLKQTIFSQLENMPPDKIEHTLIEAAYSKIRFPKPLNEKLRPLQESYSTHQDNAPVQVLIAQAIQTYIQTKGLTIFTQLLTQPCIEKEWSSELLILMAKYLQIPIEENPLVEGVIVDGKVHWQIIKGDTLLYRPAGCSDVRTLGLPTWHLSWQQFRRFKDSGKRHGSVAITKERFVAYFPRNRQQKAMAIWDELKQRHVLNHRGRIAVNWHMLSANYVHLNSIIGSGIGYTDITNAINSIANWGNYKDTLPIEPNYFIFRPDRSRKKWEGTGRVINDSSNKPRECTRLWDIGTYSDLSAHSYKKKERARKYKLPLNYDHVPSICVIDDKKEKLMGQLDADILSIEKRIKDEEAKLPLNESRYPLRNREQVFSSKKLEDLKGQLNATRERKQALLQEKSNAWWTIAIPEALHKQGESYLQSKEMQLSSTKNPFLSNVTTCLKILWSRPGDFSLCIEDYLLALGAFRSLYRQQLKPSVIKCDKVPLMAHRFFESPEDRRAIDALFNESMYLYLQKAGS